MEISVNRALSEIKTLDSRIEKATNAIKYIDISIGKKSVSGYNSNNEYESDVKSKFQSVKDLISRRNLIKSAIVNSNANTEVTIGSKKMTVAEAIERKNSIQYDIQLLNKLKRDYNNALARFEKENERVKDRLDNLLETNFGREGKAKSEEIDAISKPFLEQNEAKLVDTINIKKVIEQMEYEIDEFLNNVDFALTEINTTTKINIPE